MNKIITCLTTVMLCTFAQAELRTETLKTGTTRVRSTKITRPVEEFEGTVYDMHRTRRGTLAIMDPDKLLLLIKDFLKDDWNENVFARYYRSPKKLHVTTFFMQPSVKSPIANAPYPYPYTTVYHYKGKIVRPAGGRFRFYLAGENFIFIRLNGKMFGDFIHMAETGTSLPKVSFTTEFHMNHGPAYRTRWFDLEPGVPQELEILCGYADKNSFGATIAIEEEGVTYPENIDGTPILPIFKTTERSLPSISTPDDFRKWEKSKKEAKFIKKIGSNALFELKNGEKISVPVENLSIRDNKYIKENSPPNLYLNVAKNVSESHGDQIIEFKIKVKYESISEFILPLNMHFFAFSKNNEFIRHDHEEDIKFINSEYEFNTSPTTAFEEYGGYLLIITDSKHRVIDTKGTNKKALENTQKLKNYSVRKYIPNYQ